MKAKKIIKNKDVVFIENNRSITTDLEMYPSGKNEGLLVVIVDKCSKSPMFDGGGELPECNEQVKDSNGRNKHLHEGPTNNDAYVEASSEEW